MVESNRELYSSADSMPVVDGYNWLFMVLLVEYVHAYIMWCYIYNYVYSIYCIHEKQLANFMYLLISNKKRGELQQLFYLHVFSVNRDDIL